MNRAEALKHYWEDVRAGKRPKPSRKTNGTSVTRKTRTMLDRTFGTDHDKALIVTLHLDGRIDIRPERTRRVETLALIDVYRYAIRCRVGRGQLEKARERKAKKAERLARQRQERAERRLFGK